MKKSFFILSFLFLLGIISFSEAQAASIVSKPENLSVSSSNNNHFVFTASTYTYAQVYFTYPTKTLAKKTTIVTTDFTGQFTAPFDASSFKANTKLNFSFSVSYDNGKTKSAPVNYQIVKGQTKFFAPVLTNVQNVTLSNVKKYPITGKTRPNSTVFISIYQDSKLISLKTTANKNGDFTTATDLSKSSEEGVTKIEVYATDLTKTKSETLKLYVTRLVRKPTYTFTIPTDPITIQTDETKLKIVGKTSYAQTGYLTITDSKNKKLSYTTVRDSNFTFNYPVNTTSLAAGKLTFTSYIVDKVGNKSDVITKTMTKNNFSLTGINLILPSYYELDSHSYFGRTTPNTTGAIFITDGKKTEVVNVKSDANGNYKVTFNFKRFSAGTLTFSTYVLDNKKAKVNPRTFKSEKKVKKYTAPVIEKMALMTDTNRSKLPVTIKSLPDTNIFIEYSFYAMNKGFMNQFNYTKLIGKTNAAGVLESTINISEVKDDYQKISFYATSSYYSQLEQTGYPFEMKFSGGPTTIEAKSEKVADLYIHTGNIINAQNQSQFEFFLSNIQDKTKLDIIATQGNKTINLESLIINDQSRMTPIDLSDFLDGIIQISIKSTDKYGNTLTSRTYDFTKDTTPAIVDPAVPPEANNQGSTYPGFIVRSNENGHLRYELQNNEGKSVYTSGGYAKWVNGEWIYDVFKSFNPKQFAPGIYKIVFTMVDQAYNYSDSVEIPFVIESN